MTSRPGSAQSKHLSDAQQSSLAAFITKKKVIDGYVDTLTSLPKLHPFEDDVFGPCIDSNGNRIDPFSFNEDSTQLSSRLTRYQVEDRLKHCQSQLQAWWRQYDSIEKEADEFDQGDVRGLRALAKAASQKTLSSADADLIEITLTTLSSLDKLLNLLRNRSKTLNMLHLRSQWEYSFSVVVTEQCSVLNDVTKFLTKARWLPPSEISLQKLSHSTMSISSMSRTIRSQTLSLDLARITSRIQSLQHTALPNAAKAIDSLIDNSYAPIPDSWLDKQDKLEAQLRLKTQNLGTFLSQLLKQWRTADSCHCSIVDLVQDLLRFSSDVDQALLKRLSYQTRKSFETKFSSITQRHSTCQTDLNHIPQPSHPDIPDQPEATEATISALQKGLEIVQNLYASAQKSLATYRNASQVLENEVELRNSLRSYINTLKENMDHVQSAHNFLFSSLSNNSTESNNGKNYINDNDDNNDNDKINFNTNINININNENNNNNNHEIYFNTLLNDKLFHQNTLIINAHQALQSITQIDSKSTSLEHRVSSTLTNLHDVRIDPNVLQGLREINQRYTLLLKQAKSASESLRIILDSLKNARLFNQSLDSTQSQLTSLLQLVHDAISIIPSHHNSSNSTTSSPRCPSFSSSSNECDSKSLSLQSKQQQQQHKHDHRQSPSSHHEISFEPEKNHINQLITSLTCPNAINQLNLQQQFLIDKLQYKILILNSDYQVLCKQISEYNKLWYEHQERLSQAYKTSSEVSISSSSIHTPDDESYDDQVKDTICISNDNNPSTSTLDVDSVSENEDQTVKVISDINERANITHGQNSHPLSQLQSLSLTDKENETSTTSQVDQNVGNESSTEIKPIIDKEKSSNPESTGSDEFPQTTNNTEESTESNKACTKNESIDKFSSGSIKSSNSHDNLTDIPSSNQAPTFIEEASTSSYTGQDNTEKEAITRSNNSENLDVFSSTDQKNTSLEKSTDTVTTVKNTPTEEATTTPNNIVDENSSTATLLTEQANDYVKSIIEQKEKFVKASNAGDYIPVNDLQANLVPLRHISQSLTNQLNAAIDSSQDEDEKRSLQACLRSIDNQSATLEFFQNIVQFNEAADKLDNDLSDLLNILDGLFEEDDDNNNVFNKSSSTNNLLNNAHSDFGPPVSPLGHRSFNGQNRSRSDLDKSISGDNTLACVSRSQTEHVTNQLDSVNSQLELVKTIGSKFNLNAYIDSRLHQLSQTCQEMSLMAKEQLSGGGLSTSLTNPSVDSINDQAHAERPEDASNDDENDEFGRLLQSTGRPPPLLTDRKKKNRYSLPQSKSSSEFGTLLSQQQQRRSVTPQQAAISSSYTKSARTRIPVSRRSSSGFSLSNTISTNRTMSRSSINDDYHFNRRISDSSSSQLSVPLNSSSVSLRKSPSKTFRRKSSQTSLGNSVTSPFSSSARSISYQDNISSKSLTPKEPKYRPTNRKVDQAVGRIVNELNFPVSIAPVDESQIHDMSGKYWIGNPEPRLYYCRILRSSTCMVRVGGGWQELSHFLRSHHAPIILESHMSLPGPTEYHLSQSPNFKSNASSMECLLTPQSDMKRSRNSSNTDDTLQSPFSELQQRSFRSPSSDLVSGMASYQQQPQSQQRPAPSSVNSSGKKPQMYTLASSPPTGFGMSSPLSTFSPSPRHSSNSIAPYASIRKKSSNLNAMSPSASASNLHSSTNSNSSSSSNLTSSRKSENNLNAYLTAHVAGETPQRRKRTSLFWK